MVADARRVQGRQWGWSRLHYLIAGSSMLVVLGIFLLANRSGREAGLLDPANLPAGTNGETTTPRLEDADLLANNSATVVPPSNAVPPMSERLRAALTNLPSARAPSAATIQAQQMIAALSRMDFSTGTITREQAASVKQQLEEMQALGKDALPAIREFLEQNLDLDYTGLKGANAPHRSLRSGLIDALAHIGGPEAIAIALEALQTTGAPREIAQLVQFLEKEAPGQYREIGLSAAREVLSLATERKLDEQDVAPLFSLLQTYGDQSVVTDLKQATGHWRYYAVIALAGLPDNQGVSSLVQIARDTASLNSANRSVALQMLAQLALQSPEARAVLLEQARLSQIPTSAWPLIASALGGNRLEYGSNPLASEPGGNVLQRHRVVSGNQNFNTISAVANMSDEQIQQQTGVIDEMLAVTPDPAARAALQKARTMLLSKG